MIIAQCVSAMRCRTYQLRLTLSDASRDRRQGEKANAHAAAGAPRNAKLWHVVAPLHSEWARWSHRDACVRW